MAPFRSSITIQEDHPKHVSSLPLPLINQFIEPTETVPDLSRNVVYTSLVPKRSGHDTMYCRCLDSEDFHLDQVTGYEEIVADLTGHVIPPVAAYTDVYTVSNVGTRS